MVASGPMATCSIKGAALMLRLDETRHPSFGATARRSTALPAAPDLRAGEIVPRMDMHMKLDPHG